MQANNLVVVDAFETYNSLLSTSRYRKKNVSFILYNTSETATAVRPTINFWFTDPDGDVVCKSKISTPLLQPLDNVILFTFAEISTEHRRDGLTLHYQVECEELKEKYIAPAQSNFEITLEGKLDKVNQPYYQGGITNHYLIPVECEAVLLLRNKGKTVYVATNYVGVVNVNETKTVNYMVPIKFPEHDQAFIGLNFPTPNKRF